MTDQLALDWKPRDTREALRRRDVALERVESNHTDWLWHARRVAAQVAHCNGSVTADDVRAELYPRGIKPTHSNAFGQVFRDERFEWTGEFRRSAVPEGHGNLQRVWRLRDAP